MTHKKSDPLQEYMTHKKSDPLQLKLYNKSNLVCELVIKICHPCMNELCVKLFSLPCNNYFSASTPLNRKWHFLLGNIIDSIPIHEINLNVNEDDTMLIMFKT